MRSLLFCVAAMGMVHAGTAVAQDAPTGSPARQAQDIVDTPIQESDFFEKRFELSVKDSAATYVEALQLAECAVRMGNPAVTAVLAQDASSGKEASTLRQLARTSKGCGARRGSIEPMLLRGAVAETLWKQAGANPNPLKRQSIGAEEVAAFINGRPKGEARIRINKLPISSIARCQVMAFPDQVGKIMAASTGSKAEADETNLLFNHSQTCGVTGGLGKVPVAVARAALADALYQDMARTKS